MKKRLPVIICGECGARGRGRIEHSVAVAHGCEKDVSGVIVPVQGEKRKLYCPAGCGGGNTRLAKRQRPLGQDNGDN